MGATGATAGLSSGASASSPFDVPTAGQASSGSRMSPRFEPCPTRPERVDGTALLRIYYVDSSELTPLLRSRKDDETYQHTNQWAALTVHVAASKVLREFLSQRALIFST